MIKRVGIFIIIAGLVVGFAGTAEAAWLSGWDKRIEATDVTTDNHNPINLANSLVENILTLDCRLNSDSSDQIGELKANANAKYGSSLVCFPCGEILFASVENPAYASFGNNSILFSSRENKNTNLNSLTLANCFILPSFFANSSKTNSGEINLQPKLDNSSIILLLSEPDLKNENKIQASTIRVLGNLSNISYNPCLLATFSLSSEPHFNANSSVISEFFNNSSASLNINLSDNFSFNALQTTERISPLLNCLMPISKSLGTLTTNSAILTTSDDNDTIMKENVNALMADKKLSPTR